jgi:predicted ATP-dependent protease
MSKENEKDLVDVPEEVRDELTIHTVDMIDEVLKFALEPDTSVVESATDVPQVWSSDSAGADISATIE